MNKNEKKPGVRDWLSNGIMKLFSKPVIPAIIFMVAGVALTLYNDSVFLSIFIAIPITIVLVVCIGFFVGAFNAGVGGKVVAVLGGVAIAAVVIFCLSYINLDSGGGGTRYEDLDDIGKANAKWAYEAQQAIKNYEK